MKTVSFFRLMPHVLLPTFFLLFMTMSAFSQQGWERTYGGTSYDGGSSVEQTLDGGYIIVGNTTVMSNGYLYLIKVNAQGDTLWTRTYGPPPSEGYFVQQTRDTGFIIVGVNEAVSTYPKVYLLKTNAQGDTLWTKTYGGTGWDEGYSVQQTLDGGYIIAGNTTSFGAGWDDVYLIKTNAQGDTLWTRTYGGDNEDFGKSVEQTYDGGYIIAGVTYSFGPGTPTYPNVYLIKTNPQGDTLWTKIYGGMNWEEGWSVQQTRDSGYVVAGMTGSYGAGWYDVYLIKTNVQGDTLWTRTYGDTMDDYGHFVQLTRDGGYIITGATRSYGAGNYDVYLVKTDGQGTLLWQKTYGGSNEDNGFSVQQTRDGGYIVAGYTFSFGVGHSDVYLIKTDSRGTSDVEMRPETKEKTSQFHLTAKPNPFSSFATIPGHEEEHFRLYDIMGRQVGTYKGDRVGADLAPGVYFLRPEGKNGKPLRVVKVR